MLPRHSSQFLKYCKLADFSIRSIQAFTTRLKEFEIFLKSQKIRSVKKAGYRHLIDYAANYGTPSIHVTKSRVWTLRHLYHYLTLQQIVAQNIATGLQYPKVEKNVPQHLTKAEYGACWSTSPTAQTHS